MSCYFLLHFQLYIYSTFYQEYAHVIASATNYKGDILDLVSDKHSGLVNVLFGKDRSIELTKDKFLDLQKQLRDDVIWLEFNRYSKDGKTISEMDFCTILLACANITQKKKKLMVRNKMYVTANVSHINICITHSIPLRQNLFYSS